MEIAPAAIVIIAENKIIITNCLAGRQFGPSLYGNGLIGVSDINSSRYSIIFPVKIDGISRLHVCTQNKLRTGKSGTGQGVVCFIEFGSGINPGL
ncbi:MAG: hypothetical protein ACQERN_04345, partial [Thermodesulfobacteriota bacterium]